MPTPTINFSLACDDAFVSEGSKKLNVIGIFQKIFAKKFPIIHPKLSIVINFDVEENKKTYDFKVQMVKEKKEADVLLETAGAISIKKNPPDETFQIIINLQMVKFESLGKYFFKIFLDEMLVAKIPFEIVPPEK